MQRTGRSGNAQFRIVVQDSRRTPTSGKVIANLGSYDPHTKAARLNKEKAQFYLENGAQPSGRTIHLLQAEGIKLPKWVSPRDSKKRTLRHPEKLRRNQPKTAPTSAGVETEAKEEQSDTAEQA